MESLDHRIAPIPRPHNFHCYYYHENEKYFLSSIYKKINKWTRTTLSNRDGTLLGSALHLVRFWQQGVCGLQSIWKVTRIARVFFSLPTRWNSDFLFWICRFNDLATQTKLQVHLGVGMSGRNILSALIPSPWQTNEEAKSPEYRNFYIISYHHLHFSRWVAGWIIFTARRRKLTKTTAPTTVTSCHNCIIQR